MNTSTETPIELTPPESLTPPSPVTAIEPERAEGLVKLQRAEQARIINVHGWLARRAIAHRACLQRDVGAARCCRTATPPN